MSSRRLLLRDLHWSIRERPSVASNHWSRKPVNLKKGLFATPVQLRVPYIVSMPGDPDSPMYDILEVVGTMGDFLTELHKYYKDKCGTPIFGGLEEDGGFYTLLRR